MGTDHIRILINHNDQCTINFRLQTPLQYQRVKMDC
jgi:hypothetical protein